MTALLKPLSESLATPIVGPRNFDDRRGQKVLLEDMEGGLLAHSTPPWSTCAELKPSRRHELGHHHLGD
jgi:hypothetical protein